MTGISLLLSDSTMNILRHCSLDSVNCLTASCTILAIYCHNCELLLFELHVVGIMN